MDLKLPPRYASDLGLPPGHFPRLVAIGHTVFIRREAVFTPYGDLQSVEYRSEEGQVCHILND